MLTTNDLLSLSEKRNMIDYNCDIFKTRVTAYYVFTEFLF